MAIQSGTHLGPYEILSAIGAGGMGEVYRARDPKLGRDVAIKVLPEAFARDTERMARFQREAKVLASLNHPNIATIYGLEDSSSTRALVMELVEGPSLADRTKSGPIPIEEAVRIARQLADALEYAHERGIIHRDLKPANIKVAADDTAKILDFGLAKAMESDLSADDIANSPTLGHMATQAGVLLGTAAYMSPEQAKAKPADRRTDIWAFGCVLFEMVTGQQAYSGDTVTDTLAAVLTRDPDWTQIPAKTPARVRVLIQRCLQKDPKQRLRDIGDARISLDEVLAGAVESTAALAAAVPAWRRALPWAVAALLSVALASFAFLYFRQTLSAATEQTMYFHVTLPLPARDMSLAPNGHTLAVVAYQQTARKNAIWIYELGSPDARSLADTEGASFPFWSPDGRSLAYFADGKLKKLDISGGSVEALCDAPSGRGGTWNKDGIIVFTPDAQLGGGLYRVPASGGTPVQISKPDPNRKEQSHRWPEFLPDGKHFLYLAANFAGKRSANSIYIGSLDSNEKRFVVEASGNAAYAAPGYLLFPHEKTLLAQRFDSKRLMLIGEPTAVLTDLEYEPQIQRAVYAVTDSGLLVSQTGRGVALSQPTWFDRKGNAESTVGEPNVYGNISIALNGKSAAADKTDMASLNTDVWTVDLLRQSSKRLTFEPSADATPIWSPDASRLVFGSNRGATFDMYMKNSDGSQEEKDFVHGDRDSVPNDWSRDGKHILYSEGSDLWLVALPEMRSRMFLKAPSVLRNGQFSPDGKWVAYASNETGKWEVYVTSFPDARGKWQVSSGGGEQPRWRGDGKELFYLSSDDKMMAVPVTTNGNFDAGSPLMLFQTNPRQPISFNDQFVYDVTRDGQRFLIITQEKQVETAPMSVVLNWAAKLNIH